MGITSRRWNKRVDNCFGRFTYTFNTQFEIEIYKNNGCERAQ